MVTAHHVRTPHQNLAVTGDLDLNARNRPADRAVPHAGQLVERDRRRRFGEAVSFAYRQTHAAERERDVAVQRGRTADEILDPIQAERFLDLCVHQPLREGLLQREYRALLFPFERGQHGVVSDLQRPRHELRLEPTLGFRFPLHARQDALEDARNQRHRTRPNRPEILDQKVGLRHVEVRAEKQRAEHVGVTVDVS